MPTDTGDQSWDGSSDLPDSKVCVLLILRLFPYPRQEKTGGEGRLGGQNERRRSGKEREEKAAGKLRVPRTTGWERGHSANSGPQRSPPSLKTPLTEKHSNVLWKRSSSIRYPVGSQPEPASSLPLRCPLPNSTLLPRKTQVLTVWALMSTTKEVTSC